MRQEKKQATFFHEVDRRQGPNTWHPHMHFSSAPGRRPALVHLHPRAAPSAHSALLQARMRAGDGSGHAPGSDMLRQAAPPEGPSYAFPC